MIIDNEDKALYFVYKRESVIYISRRAYYRKTGNRYYFINDHDEWVDVHQNESFKTRREAVEFINRFYKEIIRERILI